MHVLAATNMLQHRCFAGSLPVSLLTMRKNCGTVGLTSFQKRQLKSVLIFFKSLSILCAFFYNCCVCYIVFQCFGRFSCFNSFFFYAQFVGRLLCLNFDEFRHLAIFFLRFSKILTLVFKITLYRFGVITVKQFKREKDLI